LRAFSYFRGFLLALGNIPFLLAKRGCQNREEYFSARKLTYNLLKNCTRRVSSQLFFREKGGKRW
jgi:hypothetical protein